MDATRQKGFVTVKVYMSPDQRARLQRQAKRMNRSLSEYVRLASTGANLKGLAEVLARVDLRMMNMQLKRLADQAEQEGLTGERADLERVIHLIEDAARAIAGASAGNREVGVSRRHTPHFSEATFNEQASINP